MNLKNLASLYRDVEDALYYGFPFDSHPSVDEVVSTYVELGCDNDKFKIALMKLFLVDMTLDDVLKLFKERMKTKTELLNAGDFKDYIVNNYPSSKIYEIFSSSEPIEGDDNIYFYLDAGDNVCSISLGGIDEELCMRIKTIAKRYEEGITKVITTLTPVKDELDFFKELYNENN